MLFGLILLFASLTLACQSGLPERYHDENQPGETLPSGARSYVGSKACSACHAEVYEAWRTTSHSYTVLTSDEAQRADYPLPPESATIRSWDDVSYVIGGRERITYADASGNVSHESYHHRVGEWDNFPALPLETCGACHFTGFGSGASHPDDAALPGRWAERNIGCESCHGPGSLHLSSYDPQDIELDYSSRSCGTCHTTEGRVLPDDEWHTTHDLVQAWNRDPHVTGGQFHSQSAFCSRCHAPQHANALDMERGGTRAVFSESKQNITCIGCHNSHDNTSSSYTRDKVTLSPPHGANVDAYAGDDDDFTTTDFESYETRNELCLHCHSGADRIELDHANASCTDCHNTFHANRGLESRVDFDANRPRLSCGQCHRDADYLMSIVFDDPVFLEPKNIHDLTTLPADAIDKYDLRYVHVARAASKPIEARLPSSPDGPTPGDIAIARAVRKAPRERTTLALARFVAFPDDESFPYRRAHLFPADDTDARRGRIEATTLPESAWLDGIAALREQRFDEAERGFAAAIDAAPEEPSFPFYLGVTKLARGDFHDAVETFEHVLEQYPSHVPSRVALGLTHLRRNRLLHAHKELTSAITTDPEDALAHYYLGHTALGQRDLSRAVRAFRAAAELDQNLFGARYALARCFRLAGELETSARIYRELTRDDPTPFDAHVRLAELLKYSSDRVAIQALHDRETRPTSGTSASQWRARIDILENNSERNSRLALVELAKALQLRPSDIEIKREVSEVLRRAGDIERAEAYFRWLSEHRPEEWLPLYRLGTVLIRRGAYDEAIRVLEKAIRIAPAEGDAHAALGFAMLRTNAPRKAIEVLELATVHAPFNPAIHTNLGAAYAMNGELGRARTSLERSLELATFPLPRVHLTHTNLALVHLRRGARERAAHSLRTALHAYPDYAYASAILNDMNDMNGPNADAYDFVLNDLLERFGEVTTVTFE